MLSHSICNGIWKIKRVPAAVARTLICFSQAAETASDKI